jgi:hypothetical protein
MVIRFFDIAVEQSDWFALVVQNGSEIYGKCGLAGAAFAAGYGYDHKNRILIFLKDTASALPTPPLRQSELFRFQFSDALVDLFHSLIHLLGLLAKQIQLLLGRHFSRIRCSHRHGGVGKTIGGSPPPSSSPAALSAESHAATKTKTAASHWVGVARNGITGTVTGSSASHRTRTKRTSSITSWHN